MLFRKLCGRMLGVGIRIVRQLVTRKWFGNWVLPLGGPMLVLNWLGVLKSSLVIV
jgi:hypothetical protein